MVKNYVKMTKILSECVITHISRQIEESFVNQSAHKTTRKHKSL